MAACLRRWMYLDHDGIVSLHRQISGKQIIERSERRSSSQSKKGDGTFGFGMPGARASMSAGLESGRQYEIFEKTAPHDEQLLFDIENHLAANEGLETAVRMCHIAELYATQRSTFVTGILRFRWAAAFDTDPVQDAIRKQSVEFEVDRDANDDAGMLAVPVRMTGSLEKCVGRKNLFDGSPSLTSHLACFLRQLAGAVLPLGFFAQMQPLPKLIYLKPFAIWFP